MGKWARRPWLINGISIVLIFLAVWIAAAFWAESSLGASFPILADLRSRILADYGLDFFADTLKSFKLTILGDGSNDFGVAGDGNSDLGSSFADLVPSATDFTADTEVPPTNTPTDVPSATPTATSTEIEPTETLTNTHTAVPTATDTPKPTKTPDPTPSDKQLIPKLECVEYVGEGNFIAYFGYKNPNSKSIEIAIGPRNYFEHDPADRGQPTEFEPGRTPDYPDAAFEVLFELDNLTWKLDGNSVTASSSSEPCELPSTPPTPTPEPDTASSVLNGGNISPPPGALSECSIRVSIADLYVEDPAPSSGIDWVKLKYQVEGFTSYIMSDPLQSCGGGFTPEGGWSGCFYGSIYIDINSDWASPDNDPFYINVWSKVKDNSGNTRIREHANYMLPASCGE